MILVWATRSDNDLCVGAGLTVRQGEPPYADLAVWTAPGRELDAEDGGLDEDAADEALRGLGFTRAGPWTVSGGQWAAEVRPA